jgi:hypothetical protein
MFIPLALAFASVALSLTAHALSPPPDGGYPGRNTAEGDGALFSNTTGSDNTAIGFEALLSNTSGPNNTAIGREALKGNTTGYDNVGVGTFVLWVNTSGHYNVAIGNDSLANNSSGAFNTATGTEALEENTIGSFNTASGFFALLSNTTGRRNTAGGASALSSNTTGSNNTAQGANALLKNTTANGNTANGSAALASNTTGYQNTASGVNALLQNSVGNGNTAEGSSALQNNTGSFNTALGFNAGANLTTGHDNIDIGAGGVAAENGAIRIGAAAKQTATYIAGIYGATVSTGVGVVVASNGQLGTVTSSARFKEAIKPMDKASEAILALKPVTFRYKEEIDPDGAPQFGLVAEQVEKVNSDLVARDEQGKPYTVRYEAVNAMLLNEFLKEHQKVEKLESTVAMQEKDFKVTIAQQQKQIEALTATVQKASDELELNRPTPQVLANNQ